MVINRAIATLAVILLPVWVSSGEVVCGKEPRLKPVQCVCGTFTNATGGPVPNVTVTVLNKGTEVARLRTGQDGKFKFGELKQGDYELAADAVGYRSFRSPIVVSKPKNQCKCRLLIFLDAGGLESCGSRVIGQ